MISLGEDSSREYLTLDRLRGNPAVLKARVSDLSLVKGYSHYHATYCLEYGFDDVPDDMFPGCFKYPEFLKVNNITEDKFFSSQNAFNEKMLELGIEHSQEYSEMRGIKDDDFFTVFSFGLNSAWNLSDAISFYRAEFEKRRHWNSSLVHSEISETQTLYMAMMTDIAQEVVKQPLELKNDRFDVLASWAEEKELDAGLGKLVYAETVRDFAEKRGHEIQADDSLNELIEQGRDESNQTMAEWADS